MWHEGGPLNGQFCGAHERTWTCDLLITNQLWTQDPPAACKPKSLFNNDLPTRKSVPPVVELCVQTGRFKGVLVKFWSQCEGRVKPSYSCALLPGPWSAHAFGEQYPGPLTSWAPSPRVNLRRDAKVYIKPSGYEPLGFLVFAALQGRTWTRSKPSLIWLGPPSCGTFTGVIIARPKQVPHGGTTRVTRCSMRDRCGTCWPSIRCPRPSRDVRFVSVRAWLPLRRRRARFPKEERLQRRLCYRLVRIFPRLVLHTPGCRSKTCVVMTRCADVLHLSAHGMIIEARRASRARKLSPRRAGSSGTGINPPRRKGAQAKPLSRAIWDADRHRQCRGSPAW